MPKSRRVRAARRPEWSEKKGREAKMSLVESIRNSVDEYTNVFVFSFANMRTNHFKNVRMHFKNDSRFVLGKNKVMKVALGRSREEEYKNEIFKLGEDISGSTGLLFTNKAATEVESFFSDYIVKDFAKSGFVAKASFEVPAGKLDDLKFTGSMYETLRSLGLPIKLVNAKLEMERLHIVCKKGDVLTPEQAKLLVFFDQKQAEFKIQLLSRWSNDEYMSYE